MGYWYLVCILGTDLWVCYGYGNDNQDGTIELHRGPASGCFKNKHVYGQWRTQDFAKIRAKFQWRNADSYTYTIDILKESLQI